MQLFKHGVKLPTSKKDWELANAYFHTKLQVSELSKGNLDDVVNNFNDVIYDYFTSQYGTFKKDDLLDRDLKTKSGNFSKNQLKKTLKDLKKETPINERHVKYVSELLPSKICDSTGNHVYSIDRDLEIKKTSWGCVKRFFERVTEHLPSFERVTEHLPSSEQVTEHLPSFERVTEHLPSFNLVTCKEYSRTHIIRILRGPRNLRGPEICSNCMIIRIIGVRIT